MTACNDDKLRAWDIATRKEIGSYQYKNSFKNYAFSRDGARIAVAFWDGSTEIFTVATRKSVRLENTGYTISIALSDDGTKLITGARGGTVIVWNAVQGVKLLDFEHGDDVVDTAFSPDGSMIVFCRAPNPEGPWQICVKNIDGDESDFIQLTKEGSNLLPDWHKNE